MEAVAPAERVAGSSPLGDLTTDYRQLETLGGLLNAKYDFRPSARGLYKTVSTWVDQDDSGTYDPYGNKPEPAINTKRKREPPCGADNHEGGQEPKKPKAMTWQLGRQIGLISPVTLRFTSDRGRALLRKLSVFPDNWPPPVSDSADDSDPLTNSWSASRDSFSTNLTSETSQSYLLRSQSGLGFLGRALSDSTHGLPNLGDLTLGHPAARGCKPCLELRQVCPLLSEGSTYPCEYCVEDDIECELVIPPAKKRACEGCQSRRFKCSYREGGDHNLPCKQCVQLNHKCVAGPESGRVRTGPALDQDLNKLTSKRAFVSCTCCRKVKRWCSLKDKTKEPPCSYCRKSGSICTFEKLDEITKLKDKVPTTQPNDNHQPNPHSPTKPQPTTKTITTRYAHPITFNYDPPDDDSSPCHFCQHIAYGILGLGPKTVTVRVNDQHDADWGSRSGYIELSHGHRADGHEPTRMCVSCTTARLRIHFCPADLQQQQHQQHLIRPMPDLDPEHFDFDAAFAGLIPSLTTTEPTTESQTQWCSVCSSPAFFHCRARQTIDSYGLPVTPASPDALGCGLLLCEACAVALTGQWRGDLEGLVKEAMAEEVEDGNEEGEGEGEGEKLRVRADAGFLLRVGELMRGVFGEGVGGGGEGAVE